MPTRNLYFSDPVYGEILKLSEDLNLPLNDAIKECVNQGLLFYKRHFAEILEEEAKQVLTGDEQKT